MKERIDPTVPMGSILSIILKQLPQTLRFQQCLGCSSKCQKTFASLLIFFIFCFLKRFLSGITSCQKICILTQCLVLHPVLLQQVEHFCAITLEVDLCQNYLSEFKIKPRSRENNTRCRITHLRMAGTLLTGYVWQPCSPLVTHWLNI